MGDIAAKFGRALRKCRTQRNLSQEALAFESDVDRVFISHIEQGLKQPTITTIAKLARGLGISPSDLVSEMEEDASGESD